MSESPRPLAAGESVEDRLQPGTFHAYVFPVGKDEFVHLLAEQRGLDVRLLLFDPDGRQLTEVDTPTGTVGREEVTEVAGAGGTYRLEVHLADGDGSGSGTGSYRLRIAEQRPATLADRLRLAAERAFASAEGSRRRGEALAAREGYRQASGLWRDANDSQGAALATYRIGWMEDVLGHPDAAATQYRSALDQLGEGADPALRATILNRWGRNHLAWGLEQARAAHERAYRLFHALQDAAGEATSLHNLGNVYTAFGANQRARESFELAAALWKQVGNTGEEARTLRNLASLAGRPGGPSDGEAMLTRAQALAPGPGGPSQAAGARTSVSDRQGEVVALAALGAALARDGKLQEAADCYARIFGGSLDAGMLVLWYQLDDESSVLWTVTADGRGSHHPLAGRAKIEAAAQRLFASAPQDDTGDGEPLRQAATELSDLLLAPVADELQAGRLLVVVDGVLDRVPFALLPEPPAVNGKEAGAPVPLVARHEIIYLSPGILPIAVGRRRRRRRRQEALMGPAVIGDPVLRRDDPRLGSAAAGAAAPPPSEHSPALDQGLRGLGLAELPALPFSRQEAEAVAALVPPGGGASALGFDATPEALSAFARQFHIVHLAALALLSPADSGLVLTLYDRRGGASAGFLSLADLARQQLPLGLLVVTGPWVAWDAAEGGLGLVLAAMRAGAARVVTSLWSVKDESTTALVRRFYRALLVERLEPGAALRQAQLAVLAVPRWRSPRHWAGFLCAGTWDRGAPADGAGASEGTIETADYGGTGGGGKPAGSFPPPGQLAAGDAGGVA